MQIKLKVNKGFPKDNQQGPLLFQHSVFGTVMAHWYPAIGAYKGFCFEVEGDGNLSGFYLDFPLTEHDKVLSWCKAS